MENEKIIKVLNMISEDMEKDVKEMGGKPFNGKTVATYLGYQAAAITQIAKIIKLILEKGVSK